MSEIENAIIDSHSVAWCSAVMAIGREVTARPLPSALIHAQIGEWDLWLNNADKEVAVGHNETLILAKFDVFGKHRRFAAFANVGRFSGGFGGYTEDKFIADMEAFVREFAELPA